MRALCQALLERGHDVTRTPTDSMPLDASDETQLLRASGQGRVIFTFNIRDFQRLAQIHPHHAGILLAAQSSWTLSPLIAALDKLLRETNANQWQGRVYWLNQWRG